MVIYDSHYTGGGDSEPVTDEQYANLDAGEYTGHTLTASNPVMFQRAASASSSGHFSGPVYISDLLDGENAADAPALHYVVFEPGVINDWHTHEGGQILIATDGVGYHQIEGQPVQVSYPGDVAYCPPGAKQTVPLPILPPTQTRSVQAWSGLGGLLKKNTINSVLTEAANRCRENGILTGAELSTHKKVMPLEYPAASPFCFKLLSYVIFHLIVCVVCQSLGC